MNSVKSSNNLVWIDMEMTGLDPVQHHILEIACLVTDGSLNIIAEHPTIVIHHSDQILNSMGDWCIKHHSESGLLDASRQSNTSEQEAERQIYEFVRKYTLPGKCPLAGNTVYIDRMFLQKYMPSVDMHLHYRIVDVSTLKELFRRWNPEKYKQAPVKSFKHRALEDIRESVQELQYYRRVIFPSSN